MAKVLAKHKSTTVAPAPTPAPVALTAPVAQKVVPKPVIASQKSTAEAEAKAS